MDGDHMAGAGSSGGPFDPSLPLRVTRLEEDVREARADNRRLFDAVARIEASVARIEGRVENLPTAWQMLVAMIGGQITLVSLLAAVIFGVVKLFGH